MRPFLLKILAILASIHASSGLLLSGMMFNSIVGTYLARQLLSNIVPSSTTNRRNFVTTRLENGTQVTTEQAAPHFTGLTALVAAARVARALGIGRLLVSDSDCKTKKCKRSRKRKTSSEEDDIADDLPEIKDSEEYSQYIIKSKDDEPEELLDELLSDDDPFNFYYIMKDQQKRISRKNRMRQMRQSKEQSQRFPVAEMQAEASANKLSMQRFPAPTLRRGILPFYFRYRKPVYNK